MAKQSAGILLFRKAEGRYEVLIVHPGGPFWTKKDSGSWSIPKGEFDDSEEPLAAAKREFQEETNMPAPPGDYQPLGEYKQSSGKVVHAFAVESDVDLEHFKSNMFDMEWPPKSGKKQEFPENDKAAWLPFATAKVKLVQGQVPILEALAARLGLSIGKREPPAKPQTSLF